MPSCVEMPHTHTHTHTHTLHTTGVFLVLVSHHTPHTLTWLCAAVVALQVVALRYMRGWFVIDVVSTFPWDDFVGVRVRHTHLPSCPLCVSSRAPHTTCAVVFCWGAFLVTCWVDTQLFIKSGASASVAWSSAPKVLKSLRLVRLASPAVVWPITSSNLTLRCPCVV